MKIIAKKNRPKLSAKMFLKIFVLTAIAILQARAQSDPCLGAPNGFLPDRQSCNQYWSCSGGRGKLQTCPESSPIFNPTLKVCGPDDGSCEVFCAKDSIGIKRKPVEGSCRKYELCANGLLIERDCGEGYGFDYVTEDCDVVAKADCLWCPSDGKLYRLPNKKDCGAYYDCLRGVAYPRK